MTRVVVVGDLMTDTVAHAALPLARGSDTPATVTMHGGGSGANIAAWLAVDGAEVAFVGRRGADIAGRNRDMELMGYGVDARLVMDPERPTGTCVVMITHKCDTTMLSDPGANAAQAAVLTGRDDPAQAARVLTAWYPQVVVKLGPDGALFANGRPEAIRAPAQVVDQFVDGTGS